MTHIRHKYRKIIILSILCTKLDTFQILLHEIESKIDDRGLVLTEDISWSDKRQCSRERTKIPGWSFDIPILNLFFVDNDRKLLPDYCRSGET